MSPHIPPEIITLSSACENAVIMVLAVAAAQLTMPGTPCSPIPPVTGLSQISLLQVHTFYPTL